MKSALKILSTSFAAFYLASCSTEPVYYDASLAPVSEDGTVSVSSGKYAEPIAYAPAPKPAPAPEPKAAPKKKKKCACAKTAKAKKDKYKNKYSNVSMQGSDGLRQIGLVPTMKPLAE
ncbi:hypothetical protein [Rubritalea marina]|uniref:hypothetical protein n=1 Tax=Rubritalea marina TaxID=361055 RepID=UPI00036ACCBF|nr:hypothetical protein [Rubritalea marina]